MYLHPTYAVSVDREPLGILDAWMWAREPKDAEGVRAGVKESLRWVEGYARLAEMAPELPDTRLVYVADRESDILDLMVKARDLGQPVDWLVRSQHNRALPNGVRLWDDVATGEAVGEIRFTLPSRHGQPKRAIRQHVWVKRVALPDRLGGTVHATCVMACEAHPPQGVKAVEWRFFWLYPGALRA